VRGIQLGIGLKLAVAGLGWLGDLRWVGFDSVVVAAVFAAMLVLSRDGPRPLHWFRGVPVLLVFFAAGFLVLALTRPQVYSGVHLAWPRLTFDWPTDIRTWATGLTKVAVPQLPLTLLNSVIAVCALSADYFPGRGIPPGRMALSVGVMNLLSVPFGGIPMCHGAGGLAAQHRFGARTGGSVVILGVLKIAAGLVLGASLTTVLNDYPRSILAVMLIFAGASLASAARDCLQGIPLVVLVVTAATILLTNTAVGVLVGLVTSLLARTRSNGEAARRCPRGGRPAGRSGATADPSA
jgi:MFS superfamily sulfate permease-like transporter